MCKITKIAHEEIAQVKRKGESDTENLLVLHFEGKIPKMVLNKTSAAIIAKLYSPYTDKWIGKSVQVFATARSVTSCACFANCSNLTPS